MSDKFIPGLFVKPPRQPFLKGHISMKRVELINWLQEQRGEWINLDIKEGKKTNDDGSPKWYAQINDYRRDSAPDADPPRHHHKAAPAVPSESTADSQSLNDFIDDPPFSF